MAVSNKGFVLDYSDHMSSHYKRMASVKGTKTYIYKHTHKENVIIFNLKEEQTALLLFPC